MRYRCMLLEEGVMLHDGRVLAPGGFRGLVRTPAPVLGRLEPLPLRAIGTITGWKRLGARIVLDVEVPPEVRLKEQARLSADLGDVRHVPEHGALVFVEASLMGATVTNADALPEGWGVLSPRPLRCDRDG